jgi:hypothetical protein
VKRLRTLRFRNYVLPVILAALGARAFMPSGFMVTADNNPVMQSTLCSRDQGRSSPIELPGEQPHRQCDHCLSPMGTAPTAFALKPATVEMSPLLAALQAEQVVHSPLQRVQAARAPPQA